MPDVTPKCVLPRLWTLRRLVQCCALAVVGIVQAVAALVISFSASAMLEGDSALVEGYSVSMLFGATVATFILAVGQMRYSEAFAVSYVHDLRLHFMRHVLLAPADAVERNHGLILTRIVNDMSALKLWLSRGLVTAFAVVPMMMTIGLGLFLFQPHLLVVLALSVSLWLVVVGLSLIPLTEAIKVTRRRRGSIASFAGIVLPSRLGILVQGRIGPTLRNFGRRSRKLTEALVVRATWSGIMRSSGQLVFPVSIFLYVVLPASGGETPSATLFFMIAAFVSAQLTLVSAGLEYFQGARIARQKIANVLRSPVLETSAVPRMRRRDWATDIHVRWPPATGTAREPMLTLKHGRMSAVTSLGQRECVTLFDALSGLACREERTMISLGSRALDTIEERDIWKWVAVMSPGTSMAEKTSTLRIYQTHRSGRVSREELMRLSRMFGVDVDSGELATRDREHALRRRAVRVLARNTPVVLVDDPELATHRSVCDLFFNELVQRGATVVVAGAGIYPASDFDVELV